MEKGKIIISKWHFKLGLIPVYWNSNDLLFHFGIFKPTQYPSEGEMFSKDDYKGFWFRRVIAIKGIEVSFLIDVFNKN